MDKGLGTLYHKLTNLFHTNTPTSSTSNASSTHETGTTLPISTFLDRLIPSSPIIHNNDRRRQSPRVFHQISIKTNDNRSPSPIFPTYTEQTTPINTPKQQQ